MLKIQRNAIIKKTLNKAVTDFSEDYESFTELYWVPVKRCRRYNAQISPWLNIAPSIQYITNPGGGAASDAVVLGVRAQTTF